jgi:hypothetical protein
MTTEEIAALQHAICKSHGCGSFHLDSVSVPWAIQGQIAWDGEVGIFSLSGHPEAQQCYAWALKRDSGATEYVAILKVSPVDSPLKAVQAYMASQAKK